MVRNIEKILKDKEYLMIIADLINQEKVQEMKQYRQHHKINCFEHCLFVSYIFNLQKTSLGLHISSKSGNATRFIFI